MDGRIFQLTKILQERLDHQWTVDEMATLVNLSTPHLQKLFKAETGRPPIAFLKDLRLEKARELLENSFRQIKQIGHQTGLVNDSNFTRDFKQKFGLTPTEYRRNFREMEQSSSPHGQK